ncbi:MAG TPA: hypothetical protein VMM59_00430 [Thermohalobaculum sp.]|nr:hypothetical protein [Thermohalobaculum sp.]
MRIPAVLAAIISLGLIAAAPAGGAGDFAPGEKLTLTNCGRCHVVNEKNRRGGIESTPSFAIIRSWPDWEDKMRAFWALRPHIVFTQIARVTPPFPHNRPSPIHPIRLTLDEVERIVEYARTIEPADLGDKVQIR